MRWKNYGEMSSDEGQKVYFSGEEDRREYGVGFLVHKDMVSAFLGCRPVSSRLISIRLRADPFNATSYRSMHQHLDMITMKLTTSISNSRKSLTQHLRRPFWLYKRIGMLKLEGMHRQSGETYVHPTVMLRQMREVSDSLTA